VKLIAGDLLCEQVAPQVAEELGGWSRDLAVPALTPVVYLKVEGRGVVANPKGHPPPVLNLHGKSPSASYVVLEHQLISVGRVAICSLTINLDYNIILLKLLNVNLSIGVARTLLRQFQAI